ncbi:hypothetical protein GGI22_007595 [Coemansia erecta]|nr:hypothetical protein GGI22_007595 [Coemansia erecta]
MQATTLRSLGFTSGQALIRLFFKDALAPSALPARNTAPIQQQQELQAQKPDQPRTPPNPKAADEPTPAAAKQPTSDNSTPPAPDRPLVSHRHIQVFGSRAGEPTTPVQIVLPESFYDPNSKDDASLLIKVQRARLAEADRGFKMRSTEDKKRLEQHEKFKHDHPTTVVRFRFPDTTHVQATFASTEKTDELFRFTQSVLSNPHLLNTLIMQPPLQNLRTMMGTSLFDAKMTPAAVVHVQLHPDAAGSAALDLLRPEIAALAQPLPSDAMEEPAWPVAENSSSNTDATTNAALDHMPAPSPSTTPQSSSSRAGREQQQTTTSAQGTKMPKWFLAGQRKR